MNKRLLFLLGVILFQALIASAQVIRITPNQAMNSQTLTTTITTAAGVIMYASPPMSTQDVYLQSGNTYIYPNSFDPAINIYPSGTWPFYFSDSLHVDFTIPVNAPAGYYDVHVVTYWNPGGGIPTPMDNVLTSGFFVGLAAGTASGSVYFDTNQNGVWDAAEMPLSGWLMNLQPSGATSYTNSLGDFTFYSDTSSYTITPVLPSGFSITSANSSYSGNIPPSVSNLDFGLYNAALTQPDHEFLLYKHPMRCVFRGYSGFQISNSTFLPDTQNVKVTIVHSPNLTYLPSYSVYQPVDTSSDTLVWNFTGLRNGQSISNSVTYFNPPAGDTVWFTATDSVFHPDGSFVMAYHDSAGFVVSCSVDPNDKNVYPPGEQAFNYVLTGTELEYTIRFQNTGTDTAFTVVIYDTLSSALDLSTFRVMASSHLVDVQGNAAGEMAFRFPNIMLPDSNVDEPGSNGFVTYRISPLPNLPDPTIVENTAHIVFDFNAPVVTNTTLTTFVSMIPLSVPSMVREQSAEVFPNPLGELSIIRMKDARTINGHVVITDQLGRTVCVKSMLMGETRISKNEFPTGIYGYRVLNTNGETESTGRFIVE